MLRWFLLLWKQQKCPIQKNGIAYVRDYSFSQKRGHIWNSSHDYKYHLIKLKSLPTMFLAPPIFCCDYNQVVVVEESIFLNLSDPFGDNISVILLKLWPRSYYLIM